MTAEGVSGDEPLRAYYAARAAEYDRVYEKPERQAEFLTGLATRIEPGARPVMIDNRYVAGGSTPLEPVDADGDTWQRRVLADGSGHRVLKIFPTDDELRSALDGIAVDIEIAHWPHDWAVSCRLR